MVTTILALCCVQETSRAASSSAVVVVDLVVSGEVSEEVAAAPHPPTYRTALTDDLRMGTVLALRATGVRESILFIIIIF
jgi:hypothetical protein